MIGVVGGVGSGKSALARAVGGRRNLPVLDGDAAGHAALRLLDVRRAIRGRFGEDVFLCDGEVDRSALARRVFGDDPGRTAARADLQAIVHPFIRRRLLHEAKLALAAGAPTALLDAAVLLETGYRDVCWKVVFVDCPRPERLRRVAARGWDEAELDRREASQWPLDRKRAACDAAVDNGGALDEAVEQFEALLTEWGVPAAPTPTPQPAAGAV